MNTKHTNQDQILAEKSREEFIDRLQRPTVWFIISSISGLIALTLAYIVMKQF